MLTDHATRGLVTIAFNRSYNSKVHVGMTHDALVKVTGGVEGNVLRSSAGTTTYHWDGADQTYLEAAVRDGVVRHLVIVNPKGAIVMQGLPGD